MYILIEIEIGAKAACLLFPLAFETVFEAKFDSDGWVGLRAAEDGLVLSVLLWAEIDLCLVQEIVEIGHFIFVFLMLCLEIWNQPLVFGKLVK